MFTSEILATMFVTPQDVEIGVGPWRLDFGIFGIVIVVALAFFVIQAVRKG